jgi:cytochrome c-type biogenesis protein CcmH
MLIWFALAGVAALALIPLALTVFTGSRLRGRRDAALALHRAQLAELDRDLAENRLLPAEHVAARLEVQRRLLAEADQQEAATRTSGPFPLVLAALLVPAVAILLYIGDGGAPDYKARALAATQQATDDAKAGANARDEELVARLRGTLTKLDPHSETTRKGYVMLGGAELELGHLPEAADAWRHAIAIRFEPNLGAETGEAITEAEAHVTPEAAGLFKRALAEGAADAAWRKDVEKRLKEVQ